MLKISLRPLLVWTGLAILSGAAGATAAAPCMEGPACWDLFPLPDRLKMPHYRSHPLDKKNDAIKRAVIVIHGNSRNAHRYFPRVTKVAAAARLAHETLVIAPSFSIENDDRPHRQPGEVYWEKSNDWKRGNLSVHGLDARISSFAVIDVFLKHLGSRQTFPNLKKITIIGHSAGGQFTQRYLAGHSPLKEIDGLRIRYVVANPGRYMYLNEFRPASAFDGTFAIPKDAATCSRYNRYEYGVEDLNGYMAEAGVQRIRENTRKREVVLLLGSADNDPNHRGLNRSCRGNHQGRHRYERGLMFMAHLDRYFKPHNTHIVTVHDVGHSSSRMFKSKEGREVIFF